MMWGFKTPHQSAEKGKVGWNNHCCLLPKGGRDFPVSQSYRRMCLLWIDILHLPPSSIAEVWPAYASTPPPASLSHSYKVGFLGPLKELTWRCSAPIKHSGHQPSVRNVTIEFVEKRNSWKERIGDVNRKVVNVVLNTALNVKSPL